MILLLADLVVERVRRPSIGRADGRRRRGSRASGRRCRPTASCSTSRAAAVVTRAGSSSGASRVVAVDRDLSGVDDLRGDPRVELIEFDLEVGAPFPVAGRTFAAVVVTNYLWRPILDDVARAVAPGGWLLYETFAVGNERLGHPTNPDFLLRPASCWSSPVRTDCTWSPTRTSRSTSPAPR